MSRGTPALIAGTGQAINDLRVCLARIEEAEDLIQDCERVYDREFGGSWAVSDGAKHLASLASVFRQRLHQLETGRGRRTVSEPQCESCYGDEDLEP